MSLKVPWLRMPDQRTTEPDSSMCLYLGSAVDSNAKITPEWDTQLWRQLTGAIRISAISLRPSIDSIMPIDRVRIIAIWALHRTSHFLQSATNKNSDVSCVFRSIVDRLACAVMRSAPAGIVGGGIYRLRKNDGDRWACQQPGAQHLRKVLRRPLMMRKDAEVNNV